MEALRLFWPNPYPVREGVDYEVESQGESQGESLMPASSYFLLPGSVCLLVYALSRTLGDRGGRWEAVEWSGLALGFLGSFLAMLSY